MDFRKLVAVLFSALLVQGCQNPGPAEESPARSLESVAPVPYSERSIPTEQAKPFFKVTASHTVLEGPSFDRAGNLLFSDVKGQRLLQLSATGVMSEISRFESGNPGGTAIHKDGRIYVAVIADQFTRGWIVSMNPDGTSPVVILKPEQGFVPNDLVFDKAGGFYFTDFRGDSTSPTGGVYYVAPDNRTITPVLQHLSLANGIGLSPDGSTLWVTESGRNLLHKINLSDPTTIAPLGSSIPYHFTGPAPDSLRVDHQGNVYVAMMRQGRVMTFAPNGVPIGQVLVPERDEGGNLLSASLALSPITNEIYIVTADGRAAGGAAIFRASSRASGLKLFSHD